MSEDGASYKDCRIVLFIIGGLLLVGGIAVGFFGPAEMYCFYLFSEGGRFAYEGFGFGSFMFGNIAAQIIGYYLIGIVGVCLGYGHLAMRRWGRALAKAAPKSPSTPMTSPVLFISGPSSVSTPVKRSNGNTGALIAT